MTDSDTLEHANISVYLKEFNGIIKKCIRTLKWGYYKTCFDKLKNYIRNTWKTIKDILNKIRKKKVFLIHFMIANTQFLINLKL